MQEAIVNRLLWGRPYVLLGLTMLMWGANAVAGRMAVGQVSPMVLTSARWVISCVILLIFARRQFIQDWPALKPRWLMLTFMGALGFTAFNALFYEAAHYTGAVNLTIIQGAIPVLVLIGARIAFGVPISPMQVVGMVVTVVGVLVLASRGSLDELLALRFNIGDLWMIVACVFYAFYTLGLRQRPNVSGIGLFTFMAGVAFLTSLPLLGLEAWRGQIQWPTTKGWLVTAYVGIAPSLLAQIFFMRGVQLIGPGRAGLFVNLVPVFGAFLAVLILGEPFGLSSAAALALVLGGIFIAERLGKR